MIQSCLSHRDYNLISCGMFDELVAGIALDDPEKLLRRSRSIVRKNLHILDEWINSQPHVSYVKPEAGTTALVYYDLDMPSRSFCEGLYDETGALVTPGDCFELEHCVRIGYACEEKELVRGLEAMSRYIDARLAEGVPLRR